MTRILATLAVFALVSAPQVSAQIPGVNADFIKSLSTAMGGATTTQAEGAAGSIFSLAKSRLSPADFTKVSNAVPGMDGLLKAAPAAEAAVGTAGTTPPTGATLPTGLGSLTSAFNKLGLAPAQIQKAIPIVTEYVTKAGGADVGKLLTDVLK